MRPSPLCSPRLRRLTAASVVLALLATPGGLLSAQPVGLPSMGAASGAELSPLLERKLGEAIMVQGRRDPTYIDDPDVRQYLGSMGARLAAHAPGGATQVEVFGVRDRAINAFAMPGGYIGINSGLIVAVDSESELASVLAHEIGHVAQRHIARGFTQQGQNSTLMMTSMAAALLAALVSGSGDLATGVAAFGQAAAVSRQLSFSRDAEREADRAGFDMLRKAGYDPTGMVQLFNRLMSASRLNEGTGGGAYLRTHPLSIQRMSDIQGRLKSTPGARHIDSDDFWFVRAAMRMLQSTDTQAQRTATRLLQEEARALSGTRQAAAWYGLAQAALLRGDPDEARNVLAQARAGHHVSPYLATLEIRIALATQNPTQALALARAAWQRWSDHRSLAFALAESLQRAGQDREAVTFLRACTQRWGQIEPRLYQMLAHSEERLGQHTPARLAMATYHTLTGALASAVSQLSQARTLSKDFYEQSQIDVRIRELKTRMDEERKLLEQFS